MNLQKSWNLEEEIQSRNFLILLIRILHSKGLQSKKARLAIK